ncbi:hypothetical protein YC2023_066535 [Brassica napus]
MILNRSLIYKNKSKSSSFVCHFTSTVTPKRKKKCTTGEGRKTNDNDEICSPCYSSNDDESSNDVQKMLRVAHPRGSRKQPKLVHPNGGREQLERVIERRLQRRKSKEYDQINICG